MSELVFLLSADVDIQKAYDYHEEHRDGRGEVFMRQLEVALEQLRAFPESGPVVHRHYRRLLVPQFPYGIFYSLESRGIIVTGVLDTRQGPAAIIRRLS